MPLTPDDLSPNTLCWLHGFTQTGLSAHQFRSILAARRTVLATDLPRHGTQRATGGSLDEIAEIVLGELPATPVDLGGYSFGARVALHVALRHPDRIRRLVLISGTRGIFDDSQREQRRQRDEKLAQRIQEIGAEDFINEWLSQPMFANLPADPEERAARSGQHTDSLASSLREAGTGTQRWLGEEIASLEPRTLVIAGANDERFAREGRALARSMPSGSFQMVPAAGHATHLHQPTWTAKLVDAFLDELSNKKGSSAQQDSKE